MNIGIDGNEANVKNRVGSGVYAFELIRQFSKSKKHKFTIFLKGKPQKDFPKESNNFSYKIFGPKKMWTRFALPINLTLNPQIDIFASLGHYGPFFSRVPYLVTIFDLSYLRFPEMFNKNDLYQLKNWSKRSIENSKHIFTISNSTKKDIIKNYNVDSSKITVTHMGYDEKKFKPQPPTQIERAKEKFNINGKYILFIGTLQPRKNIERLIDAFKLIKKNNRSLQLVIAGKKGWLYDSIFEKVKKLKLENSIIFTDFVNIDELPALISGAEIYVLPSLWEGFGIPVIEAQACGVPVVVSNTSSLPEVIGDSGVLVDPNSTESIAEGIEKVLKDEKFRQELIQKGFKNIKRFSWQKCASQTLEKIEKIAS